MTTATRTGFRVAAYSALILFFELALIRYTAGYIHVFSFYLNFVLLATFLGTGVGLLRGGPTPGLKWAAVPGILLLFVAIALFADSGAAALPIEDDWLWLGFDSPGQLELPIVAVAVSLFGLLSLFFVPLGALLGAEFRKLAPLQAYGWDIAGGLAGILGFGILSATRQPPLVWLTLGFGIWAILSLDDWRFATSLSVAAALALVSVSRIDEGYAPDWSPYYRINISPLPPGYQVYVNGLAHQVVFNTGDSSRAQGVDWTTNVRFGYQRQYNLVRKIDTALVLGAGTGNDVSILLKRGAKFVDAVEIDPVISEIGRAIHPQRPYSDPRVHLRTTDGRAFLRAGSRKYDLIVYGTLDSHTLLSGMSSVRLDNYMYTADAFRAARARLADSGSLIVYHMSGHPYIAGKIYQMISEAFGRPPGVYAEHMGLFNYTFVAGRAARGVPAADSRIQRSLNAPYPRPTDDWPYLYLRERNIPGHYRAALTGVLIIAVSLLSIVGGELAGSGFDGAMFFLGAAFMLVETKSVTEMSLLFGSTWTVNLMVFASILVMVLAANLWVTRHPLKRTMPAFAALFAALALAYALPASSLLSLGVTGQWIVGGLMVALPVFFSSLIFSTLLSRRADGTSALAWNLIGAIVGGVLEYSSMMIGIKGLYIVAAGLYLAASLASCFGPGTQPE